MATRTRPPASKRKADRRREQLEEERDKTLMRIASLQMERQQLQGQLHENEMKLNQMVGRQRLVQEQLGEVPPMAEIAGTAAEPETPTPPEGE